MAVKWTCGDPLRLSHVHAGCHTSPGLAAQVAAAQLTSAHWPIEWGRGRGVGGERGGGGGGERGGVMRSFTGLSPFLFCFCLSFALWEFPFSLTNFMFLSFFFFFFFSCSTCLFSWVGRGGGVFVRLVFVFVLLVCVLLFQKKKSFLFFSPAV